MCNLSDGIEKKGLDKGIIIGIERGKRETIIDLVNKGLLTIQQAINELGISKQELELLMHK